MADSVDFPRQTVLVLGAGGFVGSRLIQVLYNSIEFRPVAALRRRPRTPPWPEVRTIVCDATNAQEVAEALSGIDCVVNCVAGSGKAMVAATRVLCKAARLTPPRRIVHLSSMAVYGEAIGLVDEKALPVLPLSDYAQAKWVCEQTVQSYVQDGGDAVILRPGCIHGPGSTQWTARIAHLLQAGRIGDLGSVGDGICNLTYIDDLATAILSAVIRPGLAGSVFNIVGRDFPTWNEYFARFACALGATPVARLSKRRIDIESRIIGPALAVVGRAARLARLSANLIPESITPSLARLWQQDIRLDTSQAAACLDLVQTPLDRALDESVRWLRAGLVAKTRFDNAQREQAMELGRQ